MRRSLLLCLALLGAAGLSGPARGDSTAPFGKGEDAVLLEETMQIDIASPTSARLVYHNRTQVLTPRGVEAYNRAAVGYSPGVTIRELRGAVISPEGKRAEVKKQQIADGAAFASFELYADRMVRAIDFPGVVPGSTVEYEYTEEIRNLAYLPEQFALQEVIPTQLKTLTVRYPASFTLRLQTHGSEPEHHEEEKDGYVTKSWTVRNTPPLRSEDRMPPADDLVPRVSLSPQTIVWGDHTLDAANWTGVAAFYWELARDRMVPSPEVADMAKSLTASLQAPDAKIRAIFEFAQGKINYVEISLGIGGWQPHANGDVFRHRYGDCKDKATLMVAMLRSIGLVGYPVLILTRSEGLLDRDDPGLHFNHAIVAIPREDGYLFLDPTDDVTPFGDLPWVDQGVPVLVVKDGGAADLAETPLLPADRNRRNRVIDARIDSAGNVDGTYVIEAWGQRRVQMTAMLDGGPSASADALADFVSWLCPGAEMVSHEVKPAARPEDPITVTIHFRVPHFVTQAGSMRIVSPHLARVPSLTEMATYPTRRYPVFFLYLMSETSEVRLRLPTGLALKKIPADRVLEGPGLASNTHYELKRDGEQSILIVKRAVTVSRREISQADYPQLRTFVAALTEEEAGAVSLIPAS